MTACAARIIRTLAAFATLASVPTQVHAQRIPVDDSLAAFVGIDSRLVWRALTLADGAGLETGAAIPLRPILRGLQLELRGWTALVDRDLFRVADQYAAGVHYQIPLRASPGATSLTASFTEYLTPHSIVEPHHSGEIGLRLLHDFRIPTQGVRTIRTELEAAKDIDRRLSTWIRGRASASMGTTIIRVDTISQRETRHTIQVNAIVALSASDYNRSVSGHAGPEFGFDGAQLELDLEHRLGSPTRSFATTSTLRFGFLARTDRLGPDIGWLGMRESILFF